MKKSIFNIYVPITSQEQADRLKQVCLDNGLPIWEDKIAFKFDGFGAFSFETHIKPKGFAVWSSRYNYDKQQSTEQEFMELLKQWKDENS